MAIQWQIKTMASLLARFCASTYCFIRSLFSVFVSTGSNLWLRYYFYAADNRCCLIFDNGNYSNDVTGILGMEMCVQHSKCPMGILFSIFCYRLSRLVCHKGNNGVGYVNKTYAYLISRETRRKFKQLKRGGIYECVGHSFKNLGCDFSWG